MKGCRQNWGQPKSASANMVWQDKGDPRIRGKTYLHQISPLHGSTHISTSVVTGNTLFIYRLCSFHEKKKCSRGNTVMVHCEFMWRTLRKMIFPLAPMYWSSDVSAVGSINSFLSSKLHFPDQQDQALKGSGKV